MNIRRILGCVVLCLIVVVRGTTSTATAMDRDGNWLLKQCQDNPGDSMQSFWICSEYQQGVLDMYDRSLRDSKDAPRLFCFPPGVTLNQTTLVIVKHLKDHPQYLHKAGIDLMIQALAEAFPCSETGTDKPK